MMRNILITGGNGLVGKELSDLLVENKYNIRILTRNPKKSSKYEEYLWSPKEGIIDPEAIKNTYAIIHLAGAGIADERWTDKRKKELYSSRIDTANLLYKICEEIKYFPEVFISASGIGIYGADSGNEWQVEDQKEIGEDFIATLSKAWEKAAYYFAERGSRVVYLRTGIVLSKKGGALSKLALPARLGLAAPLGSGSQYMSWIHMSDLINMYLFALDKNIKGAYNAVATNPVTNKEFMKLISKALSRPFFLPKIPSFLLKLGLGELADILLGGNRVSNEKIIHEGFTFNYPELNSALNNILG